MHKNQARHTSWQELVRSPLPGSHIVQIFDDDDFLSSAIALFAAEGLRSGDAVLLTGTPEHLSGARRALSEHGVDVEAAIRNGQLSTSDAQQSIEAVMSNGRIDARLFDATAGEALAKARHGRRFQGVRWWGEMSNLLHQRGQARAALEAEDLGTAAIKKHGATILCAFHCDRFGPGGYSGILGDICCKHTHAIPAQNYVSHRLAVNRAVAEVVGEIKGSLLHSLLSWKGMSCDMPSSQALLFWVRDTMPEHFPHVLSRAKQYHA